ncbi:hypothetical protein [Paenarthrobacter sp. A20]|uniref:hypothetical protein n=1 Tax=Paenarthrobacter sp. A20 TaxID=2817891 RepID=UPI00209FBE0F|nr:hypothetical protein [Paenarthrobacter sp. A20]MCP1412974.1 hypothetical protein [Paenarthrobacter sp. A20]
MRLESIVLLFRLFWTFILRQVLGRGLLASRAMRIAGAFIVLLGFAGFNVLSYTVMRQYLGGTDLFEPVLAIANVSVGFWVLIAYTLIRVLFLKADELLKLSFHLPATNKERTLAFALFEASVVAVMTVFVFGAFSISTVLLEGPDFITKIAVSIWLPVATVYLLLSLAYYLLERSLLIMRLARLRGLLVPIVLAIGLSVLFPYTNEQTAVIAESFVEGRDYSSPLLVYSTLEKNFGLWLAVVSFAAASMAVIAGIVAAAPGAYVPLRRFIILLPSEIATWRLGACTLVLFRSFETLVSVIFVLAFSLFAWLQHIVIPPYVLALITFQGVYAYVNSEPLRRMSVLHVSAWRNYASILGSQIILWVTVAIPVTAASLAQGIELSACLPVAGFCLSNILISTLIGIAFPPEKGNPFTVLVGAVLAIIVILTITLGLNVFNLEPAISAVVYSVLNILVVTYSILGMQRMERIRRHEVAS